MSEFETILQERLERLEAGEPLDACLEGLTEEEAGLLQMAAVLREMPIPQVRATAVAQQRAQLLQNVKKESLMPNQNDKIPFMTWLRSVLTTVPGAAVALAAIAIVVWLSFSLFRPDVPAEQETAVNPPTTLEETASTQATEDTAETAVGEPEETVAEAEEAEDSVVGAEDVAEETAVNPPATQTKPLHMAYFPMLEVTPLINARTATLQDPAGFVEVQDKDGNWQLAKRGTLIEAGQRVRTGALSSAKILFYDGSQAHIAANAELSVDQLNAQQPQEGFRTVVMTQWLGESEHHVAFRNDGGSRYEVNTPNGSGVARGTIFQVLVTADLLTHFTVIEGRVDVTNLNVTVIVVAGQIIVINPDEAPSTPYFSVSGQGIVSAITADSWTIGSQTFATNASTITIGNPQIGDIVHVVGYLQPDGTLVATVITLLHHNPANHFSLTGEATVIDPVSWVVAGQTISVTAETIIDDTIILGDIVHVQGIILPDGTLVADSIDLVDSNYPFEFVGIVSLIDDASWTISGVEIAINEDTTIEGEIEVGDVVHVQGIILEDGTWLAQQIVLVEEESDFEFTGTVNGIDPWIVSGIGFEVDEFTQIDEGIELGSLVHVAGQILSDGTWLATEISLVEDGEITVVFVGTVDNIDPWIVSGISLTVDVDTVIEDGIVVSDTVRVTAVILPDGSLLAVTIELVDNDFPVGCFTSAAIITGIDGNIITIGESLPTLTLDDDIIIEGELTINAIIIISFCVSEDGTITIITIIVIYNTPTTPPPLPPGDSDDDDGGNNGGKVTICHKGRKTLTVSQSALGGHLGHGDTVGSCN